MYPGQPKEKPESLLDINSRISSGSNRKVVSNASNIQTVLRNIIDSGLMSTPTSSSVESTNKPSSATQISPNSVSASPCYYPHAPQRTMKIDLSHSTLDVNEGSPYVDTTAVINDVMDNIDGSNRVLLQERTQSSIIKVAILNHGQLQFVDTPQNITTLAFRWYLLTQGIVTDFPSLTGWRLQYNNTVLDDNTLLLSLFIHSGALFQVVVVPNDREIIYNPPSFDGINAATVQPFGNKIYFRSIERSKISPEQPSIEVPKAESLDEMKTTRRPEKKPIVDYFPILHRDGYYMVPSHFDMARLSEEEVSTIKDFTVGHEGVGEIIWEGITNVCYMNLDHRVVIEMDYHNVPYVQLYPIELYLKEMPPVGCELNKPAIIRLFNMHPISMRTEAGLDRYEEMLRQMVEAKGAHWIRYDREKEILEFKEGILAFHGTAKNILRTVYKGRILLICGMNFDSGSKRCPYLSNYLGSENNIYSNRCPRDFFSTFTHPLPAQAGMKFFHSAYTSPIVTGEVPPGSVSFYPINPLLMPADPIEELKKGNGVGGVTVVPNRPIVERCASQYHIINPGANQCEDNMSEHSSGDWSRKRIWPVMGFGKLDIRDNEDCYFISLDLPGVNKECIDVSLKPSSIVVECIRKPVPLLKGKYHYIERPVGKLVRTIQLPALADPKSLSCVYINGVLIITIEKVKNEPEIKRIRVE